MDWHQEAQVPQVRRGTQSVATLAHPKCTPSQLQASPRRFEPTWSDARTAGQQRKRPPSCTQQGLPAHGRQGSVGELGLAWGIHLQACRQLGTPEP